MNFNKLAIKASAVLALVVLAACGGGGGGSTNPPVDSNDILRYPYETVFGDVCRNSSEPTPGCTFVRSTGARVTVSADPVYNSQGYGSDDLWYVRFDSAGRASVYNDLGEFQYYASVSEFAGYIGGTTIGVGVTGAYWQDVSNKQYWFGKNGVLYSANPNDTNYGQAINNKDANKGGDNDSFALKSEENVELIQAGAANLEAKGLDHDKAIAVASALNTWAVMGAERGFVTATDLSNTFKTTFGQDYSDAITAYQGLVKGDADALRDFNQRTADYWEVDASESAAIIKAMYRDAAAKAGFDVDKVDLN